MSEYTNEQIAMVAAVGVEPLNAALFDGFRRKVLENPEARAAYEDAKWVHAVIQRLKELRIQAGMSQRQVAEKIGVSQSTISEFENEIADPRIQTIARYARAIDAQFIFNVFGPGDCLTCGHALHVEECEEITGYDHMNGDHECGCTNESARLSRMLFEAREAIDMYGDITASQTGKESEWLRRIRDEIDQYREDQGWSPHGFGGEDDAAHIEST